MLVQGPEGSGRRSLIEGAAAAAERVDGELSSLQDDQALVDFWRGKLMAAGVWANEPVPLYPYPSSPSYRALWGDPDDRAWERAHEHYLRTFQDFSDIQHQRPLPLAMLEDSCCAGC